MGDNKDLLDEIDKLDDNEEIIKEKDEQPTSHEKAFTVVIVIIIVVALVMLYLFYKGTYRVSSNQKNVKEDLSVYLQGFDDYTNDDDLDDEDIDDDIVVDEIESYDEIEKQALEEFEVQKPNLTITNQYTGVDNELITILHNGNQEDVSDFEIQVIFYDSENKPIKIDEQYIDLIEANSDYYVCFYEAPQVYSRCDFLFSKITFPVNEVKSYKSSIEFNVQEVRNNELVISGKNNSNDEISYLTFAVVYYNEANQVIGYDEFYNEEELKGNGKFEINAYNELYKFDTGEEVPFARYEVILVDAYTMVEDL